MSDISIAIDFGGNFTSIYKKGCGLILKEPTLICAIKTENGYEVKAMGKDSKEIQGKTDDRTVVFSPVSDGIIKSVDYATILLKHFLDKIGIKPLFKKIKCLVPCPTGITQEEKEDYKKVFEGAGIKNVNFVPRILCSAYGSGINIFSNNASMVVDIGGSSIDIGVINLGTIIQGATLAVGCNAVDKKIINLVASKYGVEIGILSARKLKEQIGSLYSNDTANMEVVGFDINTKQPTSVVVYATDVKEATLPLLLEVTRIIETTLNVIPAEVSGDIAKNGVTICGGLSSMVGIGKYFSRELNLAVNISAATNNSCILGAGKLLSNDQDYNVVINN